MSIDGHNYKNVGYSYQCLFIPFHCKFYCIIKLFFSFVLKSMTVDNSDTIESNILEYFYIYMICTT